MLLLGRMVQGLGGETLYIVQIVFVSNWFFDQEISLAMGVCQIGMFVSFLGGYVVPMMA